MCLIAIHAPDARLTTQQVRDAYHTNRDGLGCMYTLGADVVVHKVLPTNAKHAVRWYRSMCDAAVKAGASTIVFHWRFATHGTVSLENTHPFRMSTSRAVVHNGTIAGYGFGEYSDTAHFVARHLEGENRAFDVAHIAKLTTGSRLAILDGVTGVVTLTGTWASVTGENGADVRVSNTYWQGSEAWASRKVKSKRTALSAAWETDATDVAWWADDDLGEARDLVDDLVRYGYLPHEAIDDAVATLGLSHADAWDLWTEYMGDVDEKTKVG